MRLKPQFLTAFCLVLASAGPSLSVDDASPTRQGQEFAERIDSLRAELRAIDREIDATRATGPLGEDLVTTRRNIVHDIEDAEADMENLQPECPCEPNFRE